MQRILAPVLTALLLIQCVLCGAQNKITIHGQVSEINRSAKLMLFAVNGPTLSFIQETKLKNGLFTFEFTPETGIELPIILSIACPDKELKGSVAFWAPMGISTVTGSGADIPLWKVTNDSREQQDHNMLNVVKNDFRKDLEKINSEIAANERKILSSTVNEGQKEYARLAVDSLSAAYDDISRKVRMAQLNYLAGQKSISKAGAPVLEEIVAGGLVHGNYMEQHRRIITGLYDGMSPELKDSPAGRSIKAMMEPPAIVQIGDTIPDNLLQAIKGSNHRLSDFRGKYLLINLWGDDWPCIEAFEELRRVQKTYNKELTVVGIHIGTDKEIWKNLSSQFRLNWTNLSDGMGSSKGFASTVNIEALPMFILVNEKGIITDIWVEYSDGSIMESVKFLGR